MNLRFYITCIALLSAVAGWATHNRAGEITYEQIGDLTIRATITTYTKTSSIPADRDTLILNWGDGSSTMVPRANGNGTPLPNDIKINYYIAEHTYPGRATYTLSMMDPNRIGGISNVNPPNSDGVPFYIETTFTFLNTQFQGFNSSPVLLQPPLDFACVGQKYIHNPNAYDPDGDSLSYELIIPLQDSGMLVPNYIFPDQIGPGGNNVISLHPVTGDFVWLSPQVAGTYNIAFRIHEYRNGVRINSMIRDMQIIVLQCDNNPPEVTSQDEFCVVAGETLQFDVFVDDPDGNLVSLTVLGGPLVISDNANISVSANFMQPPFSATFTWRTECNEIAEHYYTLVFKAVDDALGGIDTTGLADLHSVRVKVVGPAPQDVSAESGPDNILVSWASPYSCEETEDDYFRGFSVWRRTGSNSFEIDTCTPGLEGRGYTQIGFNILDKMGDRYVFSDVDVERGKTYCYRVLGEFSLLSSTGNPFNRVASLPSDEFCIQLNRDIPLLTKVSVTETGVGGAMEIEWLKPLASALDTILNPGPYRFQLMQSTGIGTADYAPVANGNFTSNTFHGLDDTMVVHSPLNTQATGHQYKVDFYVKGEGTPFDEATEASSVFLSTSPTDRAVNLSWDYITPWENYAFEVYRDDGSGSFELLSTTSDIILRDEGLENEQEYCYFIRAYGSYGISSLPEPLINDSQIQCAVPRDDVPPCAPIADVSNICKEAANTTPEEAFENTVSWNNDPGCADDDIAFYTVYFSPVVAAEPVVIGTRDVSEPHFIVHQPDEGIAGCYTVTATDGNGNESAISDVICVENCPYYALPNTFTPNGDGSNDRFIPYPYRFVERVEFNVFNRWGQLVFKTTNPDLNWDGRNLQGSDLSDGVYHYVCKVFEQASATGAANVQVLKGYIELLRGSH